MRCCFVFLWGVGRGWREVDSRGLDSDKGKGWDGRVSRERGGEGRRVEFGLVWGEKRRLER